MMDFANLLTYILPILSILISIFEFVSDHIKHRNQYEKIELDKVNIEKAFVTNSRILLDESSLRLDDQAFSASSALGLIEEYIAKILNALNDFYPKCSFDISILRLDKTNRKAYRVTDVKTDTSNSCYSLSERNVDDNTELCSILSGDYRFFLVSDVAEFDKLVMPYHSSNKKWATEYKTSMVVPIAKNKGANADIVGFIQITSPQSLSNTDKNKRLLQLLDTASSELAEPLQMLPVHKL